MAIDPFGFLRPTSGVAGLNRYLEQALVPGAMENLNLDQYLQGVNLASGFHPTQVANQNLSAANQVLSSLYQDRPELFKGGSFTPWASEQDWITRQNSREGFNEGVGLGDLIGDIPGYAKDLMDTPLPYMAALAAGVGYANPGAAGAAGGAGSAAAGGTLMPAAIPPVDPTFGGALAQVGPGSWAQPAWTGGAFGGGASLAAGSAASAPSSYAGTAPGVAAGGAAGGAAASTGIGSLLSNPTALGMAGGALLGGLGGSEQAGTVTVEEGLPDWLMPYVKPALDRYSTQLQNYQVDPYGIMPDAMKEFQNTLSGMYLDPSTNKYLEDYYKLGAERIKGTLSPSFGHMQAFGSHSGYNEALSRGLGDFATGLFGGAYEKERDRMSNMTSLAPNFLTQSSTASFAPYQQYLSSVGSLGKKKDQPFFENPFGNILGGAMVGGSFGNIWK